jgi:hypothetical protein
MFGPDGFQMSWDGSAPVFADLSARDHELFFNYEFEIWREPRGDTCHRYSARKMTCLIEYRSG